jgi:four helix bundle protein
MRDQLQRAAVSVPANIAEGYERAGRKEYLQFLMIAKGSAGELRCLIQVAARLKYVHEENAASLIRDSLEISRMLKGLANSLRQE